MIAPDVMQTEFHTLSPENTVAQAVKQFQKASEAEAKKIFGLKVTDENENLARVIEGLMVHRFGAVLIRDLQDNAVGVVSKSDLVVAYKHGMTVDATASAVMGTPVHTCGAEADLAEAIQMMLFKDVQRIFVHGHDPANIIGILSLSDAARFRSGTCRACAPSRLMRD